jgi:hypothetical protein
MAGGSVTTFWHRAPNDLALASGISSPVQVAASTAIPDLRGGLADPSPLLVDR